MAAALGGCLARVTPPGGAGDPLAPTPARPRIVSAEARLSESYEQGGRMTGEVDVLPGREAVVGTDEWVFSVKLDPVPSADWYARNVKVVGGNAAPLRQDLFGLGMVEMSFPAGKAGERVSITLSSVILPEAAASRSTTAVYDLRRAPEPTATLDVWRGNSWYVVEPGNFLGERPLRLRLVFSKPMDKGTVVAALDGAVPGYANLNWPDARTVAFELPQPPPALRIPLHEMRDIEGLWAHGGTSVAFTGSPPRLHSWRPGDSDGRPVINMPANLSSVAVNSGGNRYLASYTAETTSLVAPGRDQAKQVISPGSGPSGGAGPSGGVGPAGAASGAPRLDLPGYVVGWADANTIVLATRESWALVSPEGVVRQNGPLPDDSLRLLRLSPDGSSMAGLLVRWDEADAKTGLAPVDLAVIKFAGGGHQWVREFGRIVVTNTEGVISAAPAWSPDGKHVAGLSDTAEGAAIVVADLATGETQLKAKLPVIEQALFEYLSWSPDGRWWMVGSRLVSVATGEARAAGRWLPRGEHYWSPDSRHVAVGALWGRIEVVRVGGGGADAGAGGGGGAAQTSLGVGLPVGWSADGVFWYVVWPDADHRYNPYI
jgi:roadblock/LC7 domain-containing protein